VISSIYGGFVIGKMLYGRSCKFNRIAPKQYQTRSKSRAHAYSKSKSGRPVTPIRNGDIKTVHNVAEKM
jgi:hypothetical protein